ncbi:MAG: carbohydrate-binding family 9-like protein [Flavitalea sp.]
MKIFFLSIVSAASLALICSFVPHKKIKALQAALPEQVYTPEKLNTQYTDHWTVKKCADFEIDGKGMNAIWATTSWGVMTKLDPEGKPYVSKFKVLYSEKGLYILFAGEDDKITTKDYKDFEEIYEGDVFEVFFHPQKDKPQYFEYEINQLDKQLILTLVHTPGENVAWAPWNYEYRNKQILKRKVDVAGGGKVVNGRIRSWTAELFFPYSIFGLLPGVPPKSGDTWDANFCRIDYDSGSQVEWSWSKAITTNFHDLDKLGAITFE